MSNDKNNAREMCKKQLDEAHTKLKRLRRERDDLSKLLSAKTDEVGEFTGIVETLEAAMRALNVSVVNGGEPRGGTRRVLRRDEPTSSTLGVGGDYDVLVSRIERIAIGRVLVPDEIVGKFIENKLPAPSVQAIHDILNYWKRNEYKVPLGLAVRVSKSAATKGELGVLRPVNRDGYSGEKISREDYIDLMHKVLRKKKSYSQKTAISSMVLMAEMTKLKPEWAEGKKTGLKGTVSGLLSFISQGEVPDSGLDMEKRGKVRYVWIEKQIRMVAE